MLLYNNSMNKKKNEEEEETKNTTKWKTEKGWIVVYLCEFVCVVLCLVPGLVCMDILHHVLNINLYFRKRRRA